MNQKIMMVLNGLLYVQLLSEVSTLFRDLPLDSMLHIKSDGIQRVAPDFYIGGGQDGKKPIRRYAA